MTVTTPLEVYTPNSFIHLFYNSPYMDIVNMHSVLITPSDSVLWEWTMETSYLVGSFPCQLSQISLTDIPVWDGIWEQAYLLHNQMDHSSMSFQKVAGSQSLVSLLPPLTGTLHTGSNMTSACRVRVGGIDFHIPDS